MRRISVLVLRRQVQKLIEKIHTNPNTPPQEKELILAISKEFASVDALGRLVPVLRMSQTYEKKARIMIGYIWDAQKMELHRIVREAMARMKADFKMGEAPQGNLERQVREGFKIGKQYEEEKDCTPDRKRLGRDQIFSREASSSFLFLLEMQNQSTSPWRRKR